MIFVICNYLGQLKYVLYNPGPGPKCGPLFEVLSKDAQTETADVRTVPVRPLTQKKEQAGGSGRKSGRMTDLLKKGACKTRVCRFVERLAALLHTPLVGVLVSDPGSTPSPGALGRRQRRGRQRRGHQRRRRQRRGCQGRRR